MSSTPATTGMLSGLPNDAEGDFRFQGMWRDAATGLYHVRARAYEAEVGRFTSLDSASASRLEPVASGFVFAENRPTAARDPSGRWTLQEVQTVVVVLGTLVGAVSNGIANRALLAEGRYGAWVGTVAVGGATGALASFPLSGVGWTAAAGAVAFGLNNIFTSLLAHGRPPTGCSLTASVVIGGLGNGVGYYLFNQLFTQSIVRNLQTMAWVPVWSTIRGLRPTGANGAAELFWPSIRFIDEVVDTSGAVRIGLDIGLLNANEAAADTGWSSGLCDFCGN